MSKRHYREWSFGEIGGVHLSMLISIADDEFGTLQNG